MARSATLNAGNTIARLDVHGVLTDLELQEKTELRRLLEGVEPGRLGSLEVTSLNNEETRIANSVAGIDALFRYGGA